MITKQELYDNLVNIPEGWVKAFGEQLVNEIYEVVEKNNLEDYKVLEVKEKFGMLRWHDHKYTKEIVDIITKYEDISTKTCYRCGGIATKNTVGWFLPVCDECDKK